MYLDTKYHLLDTYEFWQTSEKFDGTEEVQTIIRAKILPILITCFTSLSHKQWRSTKLVFSHKSKQINPPFCQAGLTDSSMRDVSSRRDLDSEIACVGGEESTGSWREGERLLSRQGFGIGPIGGRWSCVTKPVREENRQALFVYLVCRSLRKNGSWSIANKPVP
jgi:hypothetical protein